MNKNFNFPKKFKKGKILSSNSEDFETSFEKINN